MNTRRTTARKEEGGVANDRIPRRRELVPIVRLEVVNEVVPPPKTQGPQVP